jgi:hypothetical protein
MSRMEGKRKSDFGAVRPSPPKADVRRDLPCRESQDLGLPNTVTVIAPAIEPTPNPATLKPSSANAMTAVTLPIDASYGLVIESELDERMFECSFFFMKSSLASSRSICASIPAANFGWASPREKSSLSMLIL